MKDPKYNSDDRLVSWKCDNCGATVYHEGPGDDVDCRKCGQVYNSFGQRISYPNGTGEDDGDYLDEQRLTEANLDLTKYPKIKGMEGPMIKKIGGIDRVVYYDPQESEFFDPKNQSYIEISMKALNQGVSDYRTYGVAEAVEDPTAPARWVVMAAGKYWDGRDRWVDHPWDAQRYFQDAAIDKAYSLKQNYGAYAAKAVELNEARTSFKPSTLAEHFMFSLTEDTKQ